MSKHFYEEELVYIFQQLVTNRSNVCSSENTKFFECNVYISFQEFSIKES